MRSTILLACVPLAMAAYAAELAAPPRPAPTQVAQALSCSGAGCPAHVETMDLISTATCHLVHQQLRGCAIQARVLVAPPLEIAVPVRTVFRRVWSGTCSTPHPLQLSVTSDALEEGALFRFIQDGQLVLRAPGRAPIARLNLADGYALTGNTSFDASCAIGAEISMNEPDVDNVDEARAILASIELELVRAKRERTSYQQLLLFYGAHAFLRTVAESLHDAVTNDRMQALRAAYLNALPAFDTLNGASACETELGAHYRTLLELSSTLFALGDPADWRNPDGSTKTLANLYSEFRGDGVVARIEALIAAANPALEEVYRDAYEAAALAVAELEAKLALARVQLDSWIAREG